jgi:hypothetical protein
MTTGERIVGIPPGQVPKLTEVVTVPDAQGMALPLESVSARLAASRAAHAPEPSEDQLVARVLTDMQRQLDLMLESRVREALSPALTRLTDALVREVRAELASTLRDVVQRAVAQELSRHRTR